MDSSGRAIRVRYRSDVSQLFGELRRANEYDAAQLLFKLHWRLFEKGRKEFVLGHASYRGMKKSNKSTRDLLAHIVNTNSLFFYGTSLTDDDILSVLDEAQECWLKACVHFWLTADERIQSENDLSVLALQRVNHSSLWPTEVVRSC